MNNEINNDRNYTVYMHTSPNGKRYIGITCKRPTRRWGGNGYGYINNEYFWRAIQKYGWDNFQHEILFTGLTKEEAEQKEIELIAFYDSTNPSRGYNITAGGGYVFNITLRPVKQYTMDGVLIKEYNCIQDASEFTGINKGNISLCCNNHRKTTGGYIWQFSEDELTEEHLEWCNSEVHQSEWIAVCKYSKSGEFVHKYKNLTIAALENNTSITSIVSCCKGESKFTANSIWRYADEELTKEHLEWCNNGEKEKKPVTQYSLSGEIIKCFDGVCIAGDLTGINPSSILKCCKGRQRKAGGFIWRYYADELTEQHLKWCNETTRKSINQYSLDGEFIRTWDDINLAKKEFGYDIDSIVKCCKRKNVTSYNYIWRYSDDILTDEDFEWCKKQMPNRKRPKSINQYTLSGEFINQFVSAEEVKRILGFDNSSIGKACKSGRSAYGYIWRYADDEEDEFITRKAV